MGAVILDLANGLLQKLHPALKTIIPQAPVGIGIDYPMRGNVFMSYMLRWIYFTTVSKLTDNAGFSDEKNGMIFIKMVHQWPGL